MFKYSFLLIFAAIVVGGSNAKAQGVEEGAQHMRDAQGRLIPSSIYDDVKGDPYLFDLWMPGKAVTDSGKVRNNLKLKYDIHEDYLIFVYDTSDKPLEFAEPIKTFYLTTPEGKALSFSNGFPAIGKQTNKSYYQVFSGGKVELLKHYNKTIGENTAFNTAIVTREFLDADATYYAYSDNKIQSLKRNKNDVVKLLSDKSAEVNAYIKNENINFKKDEDLKKLFDYYNTL